METIVADPFVLLCRKAENKIKEKGLPYDYKNLLKTTYIECPVCKRTVKCASCRAHINTSLHKQGIKWFSRVVKTGEELKKLKQDQLQNDVKKLA